MDLGERTKDLEAAIPRDRYDYASNIFKAMPKPRPGFWRVQMALYELARKNEIDFILKGKRCLFRWKKSLAQAAWHDYNVAARKDFPLPVEGFDQFLSTLYRLRQGHSVHLQYVDPKLAANKKYVGRKQKLVILSPGSAIGLAQDIVQISIIGSGSCLVRPRDDKKSANLVLAGMPVMLATTLMNKLRQVYA